MHADGEIWNAVNWAIRQAFIDRYGAGNAALQRSCADGLTPVDSCPGNRRWIQLVYDAWLLMASGNVSMLDARDALLAADQVRFGGANQDLLWNVFASRGFGKNASSNGGGDTDPVPSFESDFANNATVTFKAVGDADGHPVELFVGDYQARSTPIADTDPATALPDTFKIVPGTYRFIARGDGFGQAHFTFELKPGQIRDMPVNMPREPRLDVERSNGDGRRHGARQPDRRHRGDPVDGDGHARRQAGHRPPRPVEAGAADRARPGERDDRSGPESLLGAAPVPGARPARRRATVDCSQDSQFTLIYTSPANAFPRSLRGRGRRS